MKRIIIRMFQKFKNSKKAKISAGIILGGILICILFYYSIYFGLWGKLPDSKELTDLKQAQATEVFDKDASLVGKYFIYDRQPVEYNAFPKHLIDALISTEDVRFYEHNGIDNKSLARVVFKTILLQDKSSGGGSTITTQLAKNLFGREDYGVLSIVINKIKEAIIAKRIEKIYSKKEILSLYLNTVPFSDNTYGIESAAQRFFSKTTSALSLSEAATLVGTLKASHSYNPRLFPERSQLRRDVVIKQMVKYGYITEEEANKSLGERLEINYQYFTHDEGIAPYFREQVKQELQKILVDYKKDDSTSYDLYKDGLKVYTTLDSEMQMLAEEAMREHLSKLQQLFEESYGKNPPWETNESIINTAIKRLPKYKVLVDKGFSHEQIIDSFAKKSEAELFSWEKNFVKNVSTIDSLKHYLKFLNVGMLAIDPESGAVRTYIGGVDYKYFKYDHVVQSKRQIGSTFKPVVYTAAIENGMDPCTYIPLKEITYTDVDNWTPGNATKPDEEVDEHLNYSLQYALSHSINTVAVKVLDEVGIDNVLSQAKKMGIKSELPKVPALALGVAEIELQELAGAFATYVNNGKPVTPHYITKIEDKTGKVIAEFKPEVTQQAAFSENTREIMLEMMKATVDSGTAKRIRKQYNLNNDIAGKTGTTQNNKDGWFVGVMPKLVMVTWVGNDDHRIGFKTTSLGQGANSALPITALLLQKMNGDKGFDYITQAKFNKPSSEVLELLDCEPTRRDGFFKRLFGSDKKEKEFGKKKKKGIFSFLKKDKN